MAAPWFSTFTLFTEILVTVSVLYMFYQTYKYNRFPAKLTAITLAYEILFNISYMTYRAFTHDKGVKHVHTPFHIAVAAFHGIFSIIMFVALVVFVVLVWRQYRVGKNFIRQHKVISIIFIISWMVAIFSGLFFYYLAYFTKT